MCCGENTTILGVAIFLELLWLDLFNLGTFVPPLALFSYLIFLPLAFYFKLDTPQSMTILLLLCLPLAFAGARFEGYLRRINGKSFNLLIKSFETPARIPAVLSASMLKGGVLNIAAWFVLYICIFTIFFVGLQLWIIKFNSLPVLPSINWVYLWSIAAVGGFLSLRITPAYVCFFASCIVLGAALFFI